LDILTPHFTSISLALREVHPGAGDDSMSKACKQQHCELGWKLICTPLF